MNLNNKDIRVIFMGSADISVPVLVELIKKFNVVAVITEIDKAAGRGQEIVSPPTKQVAKSHEISCWQPLTLVKNPKIYEQLKLAKPDLIVVFAYGKMVPENILNLPEHGCLNVHPSLLPKYRGASPIQAALLNLEKQTGVSIILMDPQMDSGDIVEQKAMKIEPEDNYRTLARKLSLLSANLLTQIIPEFIAGEIKLQVQDDSQATYCHKVLKSDGRIFWNETAQQVLGQIKAYLDWPGSFTKFGTRKLDILEAEICPEPDLTHLKPGTVHKCEDRICVKCGHGSLALKRVKIEGKKETDIESFVNGYQSFVGTVLNE